MVGIIIGGLGFSRCLGIHHVGGLELSVLRKQNHADPKLVYPLEVQPPFFIGWFPSFTIFQVRVFIIQKEPSFLKWWQRLPGYIYLACFSSSTYLSQDIWEAGVSVFSSLATYHLSLDVHPYE